MDDITIGVNEYVNNILVTAQPNDQIIDIAVTETVETVLLDVSTSVSEVSVTATQNVIVENITIDYVNNENQIDINVTDATQDVTLNVTPTLIEINVLRSGGEVNILQFDSIADFPSTGSSDYFYLAKDTNKLYRWTGSAYAEISATGNAVWGEIIGTLSEQTDLQNALNLKAPINSPTFTGTVSGITKGMVGLGAVDNTSDLDKPISTATQTALNAKQPLDGDLTSIAGLTGTAGFLKKNGANSWNLDNTTYLSSISSSDVTTALGYTPEDAANKGVNGGYASLDGGGKVPSSQLPSYVDDVIEVANYGSLPSTGETGKIYITIDNNKIYRWSGSVYVEISAGASVWGGITGTLSNQTDLQSALDAKQDDLNGTGFVKASGTTISYDNTTYYPASNPSGYTANTGTVTSVALTVPSAFSVSGSPITNSGTLAITGAGTTAQYVRGDGTLATMPDISGFVPYTGATGNVDLGTHTIIAAKGTFSSSGSSDTVGITHSSGSGIALNISKAGNGEGIYVNKSSGSGNAVTIVGTLNATTLVKNGGTSSQFLKADGSVDSSTYVDTSTNQSIAGVKIFTTQLSGAQLRFSESGGFGQVAGYTQIGGTADYFNFVNGNNSKQATFTYGTGGSGYTYTLPNSNGTLALTSQLSSYLPLSGGTLTGALSGTSATFSATSTFNGASTGVIAYFNAPTSGGTITFQTGGTSFADIGSELGNFGTGSSTNLCVSARSGKDLILGGGALKTLTLASTGAATFSSSVNTGGDVDISTGAYRSQGEIVMRRSGNEIRMGSGGASDYLVYYAGASERMRITSSGNVGIGTTAPGYKLDVYDSNIVLARFAGSQGSAVGINILNTNNSQSLTAYVASSTAFGISEWVNNSVFESTTGIVYSAYNGSHIFMTGTSGRTERMRITSGGNLIFGDSTTNNTGKFTYVSPGVSAFGGCFEMFHSTSNNTGSGYVNFYVNSTVIGSINQNGTSAVSYNTTSDYRLKEDLKPINGLEIVNKIKVYDYKWKAEDRRMDGVLAHELAEVLPYAVTGEKDGERMQGVDYSKIVPVMVQAIKELKAELDTLKNK